ncbi:hypothetical protein SAMN04487818_11440 [Actinokineospora terrae]|uniref:Uncharacterized protein n=1 Tax=Actinokineospora terrae TaxID=155974 RepID=A0A1H9XC55_9PSEU|nr:hypothetical protein SAMN04487818_11440 [Actinokineospora terrae]
MSSRQVKLGVKAPGAGSAEVAGSSECVEAAHDRMTAVVANSVANGRSGQADKA